MGRVISIFSFVSFLSIFSISTSTRSFGSGGLHDFKEIAMCIGSHSNGHANFLIYIYAQLDSVEGFKKGPNGTRLRGFVRAAVGDEELCMFEAHIELGKKAITIDVTDPRGIEMHFPLLFSKAGEEKNTKIDSNIELIENASFSCKINI